MTMTRTEAIDSIARRLYRHRTGEIGEPDPLDFMEAELIVDEVASWA